MSLVQINWNPSKKDLRIFGISMIAGFAVLALLLWYRWHAWTAGTVLLAVGAAIGLVGLSGTRVALPLYWGWMAVALVLGNIVSRILLAVFFYGMITPMGLTMRLLGRDKLSRRRREDTYWVDAPPTPVEARQYEQQF